MTTQTRKDHALLLARRIRYAYVVLATVDGTRGIVGYSDYLQTVHAIRGEYSEDAAARVWKRVDKDWEMVE